VATKRGAVSLPSIRLERQAVIHFQSRILRFLGQHAIADHEQIEFVAHEKTSPDDISRTGAVRHRQAQRGTFGNSRRDRRALVYTGTSVYCLVLFLAFDFAYSSLTGERKPGVRSGSPIPSTTTVLPPASTATMSGASTPVHYLFNPDEQAMVDHFRRMADETGMPIIIYNVVPWSYLSPALLTRIMKEVPLVVGVKQSAGDLKLFADLMMMAPDKLIYSAVDALMYPSYALGEAPDAVERDRFGQSAGMHPLVPVAAGVAENLFPRADAGGLGGDQCGTAGAGRARPQAHRGGGIGVCSGFRRLVMPGRKRVFASGGPGIHVLVRVRQEQEQPFSAAIR
jgi:hypothetical protein